MNDAAAATVSSAEETDVNAAPLQRPHQPFASLMG